MSTGETASGGDKTGPPPEALKGPALKEKIAAILKDADLEQVKKGWIVVFSTSPVFSKKIIKTQGRLNSRFSLKKMFWLKSFVSWIFNSTRNSNSFA